jgi:diacylglycerol kinase family enzyme
MLSIVKGAGVTNCKTWCGEADQIERAFADAATHSLELLIVLGGDGTIRTAAEACTGKDTYLLPLPGGDTEYASSSAVSWQDAFRTTLAAPLTKTLSGGRTGDEAFFVAAIVGAVGLWMEARESLRDCAIVDALEKVRSRFKQCSTHRFGIRFHLEQVVKLTSLLLSVPLYRKKCQIQSKRLKPLLSMWRTPPNYSGARPRQQLENGVMMKGVRLSRTRQVTVQSSRDIPLLLDGERVKAGKNAVIAFVPRAVNVIVPKPNHLRKEF